MPEAKKKTPMADVAKKATAKKPTTPKVKKEKIKVDMTCQYVDGGAYNPKAEQNISSWNDVQACLPGTYKEIQEKIPQHTDFVGYLIRRGGLVAKK